jgi:hypothetical protein
VTQRSRRSILIDLGAVVSAVLLHALTLRDRMLWRMIF